MTLKELSIDHPYYCSDSNYYSNEPSQDFETMTDFLSKYQDADIEMNLIFRWDIKKRDDELSEKTGRYYAQVYIIAQRKGIFTPCYIKHINQEEADLFVSLAMKHWDKLEAMWRPINK